MPLKLDTKKKHVQKKSLSKKKRYTRQENQEFDYSKSKNEVEETICKNFNNFTASILTMQNVHGSITYLRVNSILRLE